MNQSHKMSALLLMICVLLLIPVDLKHRECAFKFNSFRALLEKALLETFMTLARRFYQGRVFSFAADIIQ